MSINNLVDDAQIIAGFAAAVALIITYFMFRNIRKSDEIKLAESVFKDVRELDAQHLKLLRDYQYEKHVDLYLDWGSSFFNTLEWLSFLVNRSKIKDEETIKFFKPGVIDWYDSLFLDSNNRYVTKEEVEDSKQYEQLKKFYRNLKSGKFKDI
jgi:hypothetical protein